MTTSAVMLVLAGCEDLTIPGTTLSGADLIMLPLQSQAPAPSGASFYVFNDRLTARTFRHGDSFNTPFAELEFPPGSLASLDGAPLDAGDSVLVTVTPGGGYEVSISPGGLEFTAGSRPSLRFLYARYGDLSVAAGSSYATELEYAEALELWRDVGLDRWTSAGGGGSAGNDVRASIPESGSYVVAAPR